MAGETQRSYAVKELDAESRLQDEGTALEQRNHKTTKESSEHFQARAASRGAKFVDKERDYTQQREAVIRPQQTGKIDFKSLQNNRAKFNGNDRTWPGGKGSPQSPSGKGRSREKGKRAGKSERGNPQQLYRLSITNPRSNPTIGIAYPQQKVSPPKKLEAGRGGPVSGSYRFHVPSIPEREAELQQEELNYSRCFQEVSSALTTPSYPSQTLGSAGGVSTHQQHSSQQQQQQQPAPMENNNTQSSSQLLFPDFQLSGSNAWQSPERTFNGATYGLSSQKPTVLADGNKAGGSFVPLPFQYGCQLLEDSTSDPFACDQTEAQDYIDSSLGSGQVNHSSFSFQPSGEGEEGVQNSSQFSNEQPEDRSSYSHPPQPPQFVPAPPGAASSSSMHCSSRGSSEDSASNESSGSTSQSSEQGKCAMPDSCEAFGQTESRESALSSGNKRSCLPKDGAPTQRTPIQASGLHGRTIAQGLSSQMHFPNKNYNSPPLNNIHVGTVPFDKSVNNNKVNGRMPHSWEGPNKAYSPADQNTMPYSSVIDKFQFQSQAALDQRPNVSKGSRLAWQPVRLTSAMPNQNRIELSRQPSNQKMPYLVSPSDWQDESKTHKSAPLKSPNSFNLFQNNTTSEGFSNPIQDSVKQSSKTLSSFKVEPSHGQVCESKNKPVYFGLNQSLPGAPSRTYGYPPLQVPPMGLMMVSPYESPSPSPVHNPASSSTCSSLSPASTSPVNLSSEDSQLSKTGPPPPPFYHQHQAKAQVPSDHLSNNPHHFHPDTSRNLPYAPERAKDDIMSYLQNNGHQRSALDGNKGYMDGFGVEHHPPPPPYSAHQLLATSLATANLDQLDVLLTCKQCDQNFTNLASFLGHKQYCGQHAFAQNDMSKMGDTRKFHTDMSKVTSSGSSLCHSVSTMPRCPSDLHLSLLGLNKNGELMSDSDTKGEAKEDPMKLSLFSGPGNMSVALPDLEMEDAKLDSLITEALNGLGYQSDNADIDSSFIDAFADDDLTTVKMTSNRQSVKTKESVVFESKSKQIIDDNRSLTQGKYLYDSISDAESLETNIKHTDSKQSKNINIKKEVSHKNARVVSGENSKEQEKMKDTRKLCKSEDEFTNTSRVLLSSKFSERCGVKGFQESSLLRGSQASTTNSSSPTPRPSAKESKRKRTGGGTWSKELIHKIVQQKNKLHKLHVKGTKNLQFSLVMERLTPAVPNPTFGEYDYVSDSDDECEPVKIASQGRLNQSSRCKYTYTKECKWRARSERDRAAWRHESKECFEVKKSEDISLSPDKHGSHQRLRRRGSRSSTSSELSTSVSLSSDSVSSPKSTDPTDSDCDKKMEFRRRDSPEQRTYERSPQKLCKETSTQLALTFTKSTKKYGAEKTDFSTNKYVLDPVRKYGAEKTDFSTNKCHPDPVKSHHSHFEDVDSVSTLPKARGAVKNLEKCRITDQSSREEDSEVGAVATSDKHTPLRTDTKSLKGQSTQLESTSTDIKLHQPERHTAIGNQESNSHHKNDSVTKGKSGHRQRDREGSQATHTKSRLSDTSSFEKHIDGAYSMKEPMDLTDDLIPKSTSLCSAMDQVCLSPTELQEPLTQKETTSHLIPFPMEPDQSLMKSPLSFDTSSMFGDLTVAGFDHGLYTDIPLHKESFSSLECTNDKKEAFASSFSTFLEQRDWGLMVDVSPMLPDEISEYKDESEKFNEKKSDYSHVTLSLPDKIMDYGGKMMDCSSVSEDELEIKRIVTELENQLQTTKLQSPTPLSEESGVPLKMSKFSPLRLGDESESEDPSLDMNCPVQSMAMAVSSIQSEAFAEPGLPWSSPFEFELMEGHQSPQTLTHTVHGVLEHLTEKDDSNCVMLSNVSNPRSDHMQQESHKADSTEDDNRASMDTSEEILERKMYAENLMKSLEVISDSIYQNDSLTSDQEEQRAISPKNPEQIVKFQAKSEGEDERNVSHNEESIELIVNASQPPLSDDIELPSDITQHLPLLSSESGENNNALAESKGLTEEDISVLEAAYCPELEGDHAQVADLKICDNHNVDDSEQEIPNDLSDNPELLDTTTDNQKEIEEAIEGISYSSQFVSQPSVEYHQADYDMAQENKPDDEEEHVYGKHSNEEEHEYEKHSGEEEHEYEKHSDKEEHEYDKHTEEEHVYDKHSEEEHVYDKHSEEEHEYDKHTEEEEHEYEKYSEEEEHEYEKHTDEEEHACDKHSDEEEHEKPSEEEEEHVYQKHLEEEEHEYEKHSDEEEHVYEKHSDEEEHEYDKHTDEEEHVYEKHSDEEEHVYEKHSDEEEHECDKHTDKEEHVYEKHSDEEEHEYDKHTDEEEHVYDKHSDEEEHEYDKHTDEEEHVYDKHSDEEEHVYEKHSDEEEHEYDKHTDEEEHVYDKHTDEEEHVYVKHSDKEEHVDEKHSDEEEHVDEKHSDEEEHVYDKHSDEEEHEYDKHTDEEEHVYGKHTDEEEHVYGKHTDEEEHVYGKHTDEEEHVYDKHTDEEEHVYDKHTDEEEHVCEKDSDQEEHEKPSEEEEHEYEKPPEEEEHEYEKPPEEEVHTYEKPPEEEGHTYEKPPEEEEHTYEKTPEEEEHTYEKPPEEEEHTYEKPPVEEEHVYEICSDQEEHVCEKPTDAEERVFDKDTDEEERVREKYTAEEEDVFDKHTDEEEDVFDKHTDEEECVQEKHTAGEEHVYEKGSIDLEAEGGGCISLSADELTELHSAYVEKQDLIEVDTTKQHGLIDHSALQSCSETYPQSPERYGTSLTTPIAMDVVTDKPCSPLFMETSTEHVSQISLSPNYIKSADEENVKEHVSVLTSDTQIADTFGDKPEMDSECMAVQRQEEEITNVEDINEQVPSCLMASPQMSLCGEDDEENDKGQGPAMDAASPSIPVLQAAPLPFAFSRAIDTPVTQEDQWQSQSTCSNMAESIHNPREEICNELSIKGLMHNADSVTMPVEMEYSLISPPQLDLCLTECKITRTDSALPSPLPLCSTTEPLETLEDNTKRDTLYHFKLSPLNYNYISDEPPQLNQYDYIPVTPDDRLDEEPDVKQIHSPVTPDGRPDMEPDGKQSPIPVTLDSRPDMEPGDKQSPSHGYAPCDLIHDTTLKLSQTKTVLDTEPSVSLDHSAGLILPDETRDNNTIQDSLKLMCMALAPSLPSNSMSLSSGSVNRDLDMCHEPLETISYLDMQVELMKKVEPEILVIHELPCVEEAPPLRKDILNGELTPKPLIICENGAVAPDPAEELLRAEVAHTSFLHQPEEETTQKKTGAQPSAQQAKVICEICSMCFRTVPGLKRHKAMKHLVKADRKLHLANAPSSHQGSLLTCQQSQTTETGHKDDSLNCLLIGVSGITENHCPETSQKTPIVQKAETDVALEDATSEADMAVTRDRPCQQMPLLPAKVKKNNKARKNKNSEVHVLPDAFSDELLNILKTDILQAIAPEFKTRMQQECHKSPKRQDTLTTSHHVNHAISEQEEVPLSVAVNGAIEDVPESQAFDSDQPDIDVNLNSATPAEAKKSSIPEVENGTAKVTMEVSMDVSMDFGASVCKDGSGEYVSREKEYDMKGRSESQTSERSPATEILGEVGVEIKCEKNSCSTDDVEPLSCLKSPSASPPGLCPDLKAFLDDESTFSQLFPRDEEMKRKKCARVYGKKNKRQKLAPNSPPGPDYPPPEVLEKKDQYSDNQAEETLVNSQHDHCEYETIGWTSSSELGSCVTTTAIFSDSTSCKAEAPPIPCPPPPLASSTPCPEPCITDNVPPPQSIDIQNLNTTFQLPEIQFFDSTKDVSLAGPTVAPDNKEIKETEKPKKPTEHRGRKRQDGSVKIKDKQYKCKVCFTWFLTLGELNFHKLSHNPSPPPTCYMCVQRKFSSREQLRDHLREKHAKNKAGIWTCGMCLKEISDVWMYNEHLREHATQFARKGQTQSSILGMAGGTMQETAVKKFITSIMQRRPSKASRESKVPRAKSSSSSGGGGGGGSGGGGGGGGGGGVKQSSSTPPEALHKIETAQKNIEMHPNCKDPSRDCHHCGKQFPKPFKLQRHLVVHNLEKIFLCHKCPVSYEEIQDLKDHMKREHEETDDGDSKHTTLYTCELCADVMHVIKKSFICSTCNYTFSKKEQFDRHMEKHLSGGNKIFKFRGVLRPLKASATKEDEGDTPPSKKRKILTESIQENSSDSGIASIASLHLSQSSDMQATTENSTQTTVTDTNDTSVKTEDIGEDYPDLLGELAHGTFHAAPSESERLSMATPKIEDEVDPPLNPPTKDTCEGKSTTKHCDVKEEEYSLGSREEVAPYWPAPRESGKPGEERVATVRAKQHTSEGARTAEAKEKTERRDSAASNEELFVSFSESLPNATSKMPDAAHHGSRKLSTVMTDHVREDQSIRHHDKHRDVSSAHGSEQQSGNQGGKDRVKPSDSTKHSSTCGPKATEVLSGPHPRLSSQDPAPNEDRDSLKQLKKRKEARSPYSPQKVSSPATRENLSIDARAKKKFRPSKGESPAVHKKSDGSSDYPVLFSVRDDVVSNKIPISQHKTLGLKIKRAPLDNCTPKKTEISHHLNGGYKAKKVVAMGRPLHPPMSKVSAPPMNNSLNKPRPKTGVRSVDSHLYRTAESQNNLLSQLFGQKLTSFKIPLRKDT